MSNIDLKYLFQDRPHDSSDKLSYCDSFTFPCSDGALIGQIMSPDGGYKENRPCVIFLHGFPGGNRNDDYAHTLCRIGCVVLVIHHRGAWGSPGKYLVSNCMEDIKSFANHVHGDEFTTKHHIDPNQIYLFGHSMGGNNAINAGKELPWLRGLILMAPYDSTAFLRKGEPERLMSLMESGATVLRSDGAQAMFDDIAHHMDDWKFEAAAEPLKNQNILLIAGECDTVAPMEDMVFPFWKRLESYPSESIRRLCSYQAGHALMGCRVQVVEEIGKFIEET